MTVAHCATFSLLTPPKIQLKPLLVISSVSNQFPSKPTNRKNHLRPKILKTLTKPLPSTTPQLPPTNPIIPIISSPQHDTLFDSPVDKVEEFQVSETTPGIAGEYSGSFGKFSEKSVLNYGLYVVGFFVCQTICSVWVLGNANPDENDNNLNNPDLGVDGIHKGKVLLNGKNGPKLSNVVYLDKSELELKIQEIREMAKEARKMEKDEVKDGNVGGIVDESVGSKSRIGIEQEVGARLGKLEKRLKSKQERKLPTSFLDFLDMYGRNDGDEVGRGSFDAKGADKDLVFKKKFKFKNPSMNARSKPKGFGLVDNNVAKNAYDDSETVERSGSVGDNNGFDEVDKGEQTGILNGDSTGSVFGTVEMDSGRKVSSRRLNSLQNYDKKLEKERRRAKMGVADIDMRSGAVQGTQGRSSVEVMKLKNSRDSETQNSQNFTKKNQKTTTKSDKHALVGRNGSSKHGEVGNEPLANKVRDRPADVKTDFWWLNLPYVLAILMCRGSDSEGPGALYNLRITSQAQDDSDSSCIVAFEDRGDADNFCYLLESFFEDLGDFRADIVPLPTKELHGVVDSDTKKVIVVKKGQLKLYAGQPLSDVEIALHSLVEQN